MKFLFTPCAGHNPTSLWVNCYFCDCFALCHKTCVADKCGELFSLYAQKNFYPARIQPGGQAMWRPPRMWTCRCGTVSPPSAPLFINLPVQARSAWRCGKAFSARSLRRREMQKNPASLPAKGSDAKCRVDV
jgi:hypothetical protein